MGWSARPPPRPPDAHGFPGGLRIPRPTARILTAPMPTW